MLFLFLAALGLRFNIASATPVARAAAPTVKLDSATFTGVTSGTTSKFLGIPFAQPPYVHPFVWTSRVSYDLHSSNDYRTGDLRFRLPQPIAAYTGTQDATAFGLACPQQAVELPILTGLAADAVDFVVNSIYGAVFPDSEDCQSLLCRKISKDILTRERQGLFINVIKPVTATTSSKLPVAVVSV